MADALTPAAPRPMTILQKHRAEVARRIDEAHANAVLRIVSMGHKLGDAADRELAKLLDDGVQNSYPGEGGSSPQVAAHVAACRLALQRAGRLKETEAKALRVGVDTTGGEAGGTKIVVEYVEAKHADADE